MTIIDTIVKANYAATGVQVEHLAHLVAEGHTADGTYMRVVLTHMQSKLGRPRRGKQPAQGPVLDAIHKDLYPHVLKGVGPEDMTQAERFRKATFARSAASTIRYFIANGGDVRGLVIAEVSKSGLRRAVQPPAPTGTRVEKAFARASEAVLRTAQRMARGDPEDARERIEGLMEQFDKLLEELGPSEDVGATTTLVARGRPSTSTVPAQLHRGA